MSAIDQSSPFGGGSNWHGLGQRKNEGRRGWSTFGRRTIRRGGGSGKH